MTRTFIWVSRRPVARLARAKTRPRAGPGSGHCHVAKASCWRGGGPPSGSRLLLIIELEFQLKAIGLGAVRSTAMCVSNSVTPQHAAKAERHVGHKTFEPLGAVNYSNHSSSLVSCTALPLSSRNHWRDGCSIRSEMVAGLFVMQPIDWACIYNELRKGHAVAKVEKLKRS